MINLFSISVKTHNLSTLHTILSTGSPLKPASFDYVYSSVKEDVLLGSISGKCILLVLFAISIVCFITRSRIIPYHGNSQSEG